MSATRKKKLHHCANHPRAAARGRCVQCGRWICSKCATVQQGKFRCSAPCVSPSGASTFLASPAVGSGEPKRAIPGGLVAWAGVTMALCGVSLGLWKMGENHALMREGEVLRQDRAELISTIKDNNREIARLDSQIAALSAREPAARTARPPRMTPPAPLPVTEAVNGLPVSFDNGDPDKKLVALTFDGASYDNAARDILDTLKSRGVAATVFLGGEFIRRFPDLVRRIVDDGHEVGNHTLTHPHLTSWAQDRTQTTLPEVTEALIDRELDGAAKLFTAAAGREIAPLWRVPYGEKNRTICFWGRRAGYLHVGWRQGATWRRGLDSNDWIADEGTPGYHTPAEVLDKIMALAGEEPHGINGGIILMHLGTERTDQTSQVHRILGSLIDRLRGQGYRFVTVSEMMREAGVAVDSLGRAAGRPESAAR